MMSDKIYIFDLEGTLTNSSWREHLIPDYKSFHKLFPEDKPKNNNCELLRICASNSRVYILTGMMEKHRAMAVNWLFSNKLFCDKLIMRPNNNFMPSPEFKVKWIINNISNYKHRVSMVFDDRDDVVLEMLNNGIPAVVVI